MLLVTSTVVEGRLADDVSGSSAGMGRKRVKMKLEKLLSCT